MSEVYRIPNITEVIRHNSDGTIYTQIRVTLNPVICEFFDLNFMRPSYRKCHIWFTKVQFKGKTKIQCGEFPIPLDEMQFKREDVTYTF